MDCSKFHEHENFLKDVLKKKFFPTTLADKCIEAFLNKQLAQKIVEPAVLKKWFFIVLPYLGCLPFVWEHTYKKTSITTFHFVKLKLFLNHQLF